MTFKHYFLLGCLILLAQFNSKAQQSEYPEQDTTFNKFGYRVISNNYKFIPQAQAIQADGKILVGGYGTKTQVGDFDIILYRLTQDGKVDSTFAQNGEIVFDIDGGQDAVEDVKVLPDQKIMLLVNSSTRIFLIKLLSDGSFDPDFGLDGLFLTEAKNTEYASDMAIQPDGKIVIVGRDYKQNAYQGMFRRFNADGSPDASFGTNGYVQANINNTQDLELNKCLIQPDGKIIATGTYSSMAASGYPLIRLKSDGSLDPGFSSDGLYVKLLGSSTVPALAYGIALHADGSIFVAGSAPASTPYPCMMVLKMKPSGAVDGSFGNFGLARADYGTSVFCNDIVLQSDGKFILAGYVANSDTSVVMAYSRFNANGSFDDNWGFQGKYGESLYEPGFNVEVITDIGLDPNQRLITTCWRNASINLVQNNRAACAVLRHDIGTTIGVGAKEASELVTGFNLYPNPAGNERVTLDYQVAKATEVTLYLRDVQGRLIAQLSDATMNGEGAQSSSFFLPDGINPGLYFVEVQAEGVVKSVPIMKK